MSQIRQSSGKKSKKDESNSIQQDLDLESNTPMEQRLKSRGGSTQKSNGTREKRVMQVETATVDTELDLREAADREEDVTRTFTENGEDSSNREKQQLYIVD